MPLTKKIADEKKPLISNPVTQSILKPRKFGLVKTDKPVALVVHSPFDDEGGSAVNYKDCVSTLSTDAGFGIINKGMLTWSKSNEGDFSKAIRPVKMKGKGLTIWIEAHGAPGWFFGSDDSAVDEFKGTIAFRKFLKKIEDQTGGVVENVVLGGCYTANEILHESTGKFNCSPARMLSIVMPGVNVMGFVGQFATARVTKLYEVSKEGEFVATSVSPHEAAVLYKNGKVVEKPTRELYCNHLYTPPFIRKLTGIPVHVGEETLYKPRHAVEEITESKALSQLMKGKTYGEAQIALAKKRLQELEALEEMQALPEAPLILPVVSQCPFQVLKGHTFPTNSFKK